MDEQAWKAICNHYSRVSNRLNMRAKERAFRQNVNSVLDKLPACDRDTLCDYWKTVGESLHPFLGTKHPAPMFILESDFSANGMSERATGMMSSSGCAFVFEARVVYTAPNEVVQGVIAHELAHALIYARFHSKGLPLPERSMPRAKLHPTYSEYSEQARKEEDLVNEMLTRWGFAERLLELWEIAVEDAPKDPHSLYIRLKNRMLAEVCAAVSGDRKRII